MMAWRCSSFAGCLAVIHHFFPMLSTTIGYNATTGLLLCATPWILRTATSFVVARHSDVTGYRFWHIVDPLFVGIAGFMIAISSMNTAMRYLSLFFMARSPVAYVVSLTWVMNTFPQSQSRRTAAITLINAISRLVFARTLKQHELLAFVLRCSIPLSDFISPDCAHHLPPARSLRLVRIAIAKIQRVGCGLLGPKPQLSAHGLGLNSGEPKPHQAEPKPGL
ncbi:hypothetical protein DFJ58DRAFT_155948 [Suillus subalutaceus]|uniref:uncharacterized protein n=1 Tax=Suillus subalutaceus TaxID=48586 RepID=UPI001B872550|nr:uncharacterized protein DFJ58DRAFT_155948 [Suillus subalutaceus]KAG1837106.1 hypothetical protein DFJ58DRAFT_155948 [Suillus subalutaceus]